MALESVAVSSETAAILRMLYTKKVARSVWVAVPPSVAKTNKGNRHDLDK